MYDECQIYSTNLYPKVENYFDERTENQWRNPGTSSGEQVLRKELVGSGVTGKVQRCWE